MLFTKDYPKAYGATPQTRLTITKQDVASVDVTLYTCLGTQSNPHHRDIHLVIPITAGPSLAEIADDVFEASLAERAVGVRYHGHHWEPVALAPGMPVSPGLPHMLPPSLYDADRWAKNEELHLALPAWQSRSSLGRIRLTSMPGEWHIFMIRK